MHVPPRLSSYQDLIVPLGLSGLFVVVSTAAGSTSVPLEHHQSGEAKYEIPSHRFVVTGTWSFATDFRLFLLDVTKNPHDMLVAGSITSFARGNKLHL
jgi:hypothetical protein